MSEGLMMVLQTHWDTFVNKYHKTSNYWVGNDSSNNIEEKGNESGDNDCIVSLPGKVDDSNDNGNNSENDSNGEDEEFGSANSNWSNKPQQTVVGV